MSLLSWGANGHGQLGLGHNRENEANKPTKISLNTDVTQLAQITGGGSHSILLTNDGKLFGCGNDSKHQLNYDGSENILNITEIRLTVKIKRVACGWEHTLAVTENGDLYAWGANNFNQLGTNNGKNIKNPVKLDIGCKIKDISAGLRHSLVLNENGGVFSWGDNKKGQLGRSCDAKSTQIAFLRDIRTIVCGSQHSAAINKFGDVIVWGCNKYGQMAMDSSSSLTIPVPVILSRSKFDYEGILVLRSGWTHFVGVAYTGNVFTWGRNDYGQLGRQTKDKFDFNPKKINDFHSPTQICAGSEHNMAVIRTENEDFVYTWGWNEHGICGNGNEENVLTPTRLTIEQKKVLKIGCGSGQNFICIN